MASITIRYLDDDVKNLTSSSCGRQGVARWKWKARTDRPGSQTG